MFPGWQHHHDCQRRRRAHCSGWAGGGGRDRGGRRGGPSEAREAAARLPQAGARARQATHPQAVMNSAHTHPHASSFRFTKYYDIRFTLYLIKYLISNTCFTPVLSRDYDHGQKWAVSVEARDLSWSDKIASSYLVSILLKRPGELLACWNSNIYINIYYGDSGTVPLGLRDFFVYLKWQITYIICICNCLDTLFACWVSIYSHLTKNGSVKGRRTKTPVKLLTTFINI